MTGLYVHVPLYRGANVPDRIRATRQSACTEYASGRAGYVLCARSICVFFVFPDEWAVFLMPGDKHPGSHRGQVSSRVVDNRKRARYAVEEHNARCDMIEEQRGDVSHLTSELDIYGVWSVTYPIVASVSGLEKKKKRNKNEIHEKTS